MSQSELLKKVVRVLDSIGSPYMLTGSHASSLQGEPRLTHDVDLVVAITTDAIPSLIAAFPSEDFYLDEIAVRNAIERQGQFNLLEMSSGDKVDFWLLTEDPFDRSRFARRYLQEFDGEQVYVSSPEDTILMKLRWAEMSGGSQKQMGDARSILELQGEKLDRVYIERWVQTLNLASLWEELKKSAQMGD